jgi:hypothetical protein
MEINIYSLLIAALSTLVVGVIWFHPKVFGTMWMKESGTTPQELKGRNLIWLFVISLSNAFFMSIILQFLVIHQYSVLSLTGGDPTKVLPSYTAFMADYGDAYRTFKHGALHGFLTGLFMAAPIVGTNALYEKRSFKYVLVMSGFWITCFTIIGGIICALQLF